MYGYARPTTPRFDALAARGAMFERAYTPSPITRRAVPAIMTGRYATTLAFAPDSWPPRLQPDRHVTVGQVFAGAGYQTFAALCCDDLFNRGSGVTAGIDKVDDSAAQQPGKPGGKAIEAALRQLRGRDPSRPVFQWIHLFEPHEPYVTHPGSPSFGERLIDKYDGEIAYADELLGRLLDGIAAIPGLAGETIVAVTADHGEQFDEHGARFHGKSLYAEELHVPLVIAVPGAAPQRIATPVTTIDVGATLMELVGLTRPPGSNARSHAARVLGVIRGSAINHDGALLLAGTTPGSGETLGFIQRFDTSGNWVAETTTQGGAGGQMFIGGVHWRNPSISESDILLTGC